MRNFYDYLPERSFLATHKLVVMLATAASNPLNVGTRREYFPNLKLTSQ